MKKTNALTIIIVFIILFASMNIKMGAIATYVQAMIAAQELLSEVADKMVDVRLKAIKGKKAAEIRSDVGKASKSFRAAITELRSELVRMEVNPVKNRHLIIQLKKALENANEAKNRLKKLISHMADDNTMIGAIRSKHLQKTLRLIAEVMGRSSRTVSEAHAALCSTGNEKTGELLIHNIDNIQGNMSLYMYSFVPGKGVIETALKENMTIKISQLPITIRASINDDFKIKMKKRKDKPGTKITFVETDDLTEGHKYKYKNNIGTTTWIANEEYEWKIDKTSRGRFYIRAMAQRNSDISTKKERGDIVEIHTTSALAQKMIFEIVGKSISWNRRSVLHNKERLGKITAKNNIAVIRLTISLFPNN